MITKEQILIKLEEVKDPEIPTVSVVDLGMVTGINVDENNFINITLTPTFVGCPAIKMIEDSIKERLEGLNVNGVNVQTTFEVQWNSNMITRRGRELLKKHGLTPPPLHQGTIELSHLLNVECPYCGSSDTEFKSLFGSALCRSIHYCNRCFQSFEQFKPVS